MNSPARGTRTGAIVLVAVAAWVVGACGSSPAPNDAAPATPSAAVATTGPVDPTPVIDATPVGGLGQAEAVITAQDIAFQPGKLGVPAGVPFTLVMDNRDTGIPHGVEIRDATGIAVFTGEIVNGPTRLAMSLPALAPGEYPFACPVHPNMTGVIIAQP
jgi:plastocyanin